MHASRLLRTLLLAAAPLLAATTSFPPLPRGFEQNSGQFEDGVLFALGERVFYRDRVRLAPGLWLEFAGASPLVTVTGEQRIPYPLHVYRGTDRGRWRENVAHFSTVRYAQIYPGIDAEWNAGAAVPALRLTVAAGGDPRRLLFRLRGEPQLNWYLSPRGLDVVSPTVFRMSGLAACQTAGAAQRPVEARLELADAASFRLAIGAWDAALPLRVEFGEPFALPLLPHLLQPLRGGGAVMAGFSSAPFVARLARDGAPAFVSVMERLPAERLAAGPGGEVTVAGRTFGGTASPPTTLDAPLPASTRQEDGWVARFGGDGRLRAATFTGGPIEAFALEPGGAVYFAASGSVSKWVPGAGAFRFTVRLPGIRALATNAAGSVAFVCWSEGPPDGLAATRGSFRGRYEGPWDVFAGTLDPDSGRVLAASFLPVVGGNARVSLVQPSAALAPDGDLWISSALWFGGGASGNTLVALGAGGSRILYSASMAGFPHVSFGTGGQVHVLVATEWPNLSTPPDAPLRAGCQRGWNLYFQTLAPGGALQDATYLESRGVISGGFDAAWLAAYEGPDRIFIYGHPVAGVRTLEHVSITPSLRPRIACVVHAASRWPRGTEAGVSPGGLYTLVGSSLGPREAVHAAGGPLPLSLAGVEVRLGTTPVPLVSVQQGLVTFHIPEGLGSSSFPVEVRQHGFTLATGPTLPRSAAPDFALFTAGGSGRGTAVALNQDGTLNSRDHPAHWGSTVTLFGSGPLPPRPAVRVGFYDAAVEYAGPVPGALPGIAQLNLRLPDPPWTDPSGWARILITPGPASQPPVILFAAPR